EDVNQFIDQINGVKLIYKLDDDQMLKLALEKIEGRALDWLHENPTVMTHGLNDLLRGLLTQFSKKSSNDDNQHCGPVPPSAPSAPSKIDVCSEEEIQVQPGIYPNMNSIQYQFDQIRLEPPPSYDSILRETVNVFPENFQATAPVIGTAPNLSQTKSEVVDRKSISNNNNKMRQKRRNKKRDTVQPTPVTPIPALMDIKLPENTPKSVDTGTKPKIICDFCKTIGHETNKCLLNASKNSQFNEKIVNGVKCAYCKAEGHLLKDCPIIPPCKKCNEKGHRTKDCSKLKENSNENSELEGIVKKEEKPAIICSYCKKEGHMGNGSSNEKNKSDSPKNEITEVQKKCIKTFTGDAS
uniref:CSON008893 protein n=1 Tax=Culicoides sonorensis TaxID=179676 RepID=A0A336N1Z8_CULSO